MTTKTLAQQTNEILTARMSANKKRDALVKLGVTPYEAMILARASMPAPTPRVPRTIFTYTFGVEIECIGCRFDEFMAAARRNGLSVYDQFYYNHTDMNMFKLTTDSSISGTNPAECVTPPLRSNGGFESLKACCRSLSEIGARVNQSCGLHVHIGAADLTDSEYCNVFVNYMYLEKAIESFLAPSRRGRHSRWCKSLLLHRTALLEATTKGEVRYALDYDRYHRVNAESYLRHKTIEFRQHQGSANFTKIRHWVEFLGKLVEFSKTNRLESEINRIEDIPFLTQTEKNYFCARRAAFDGHSEEIAA